MTGLWQVLGRNDIPFEEMTKLDYLYVTNWSLYHDLKLIAEPSRPSSSPRCVLSMKSVSGTCR